MPARPDTHSRLRKDAAAAFHEAVGAAHPERATAAALGAHGELLERCSSVLIVATGKAAAAMARACGTVARAHGPERRGLALVPAGAPAGSLPGGIRLLAGGHPVPTAAGIAASREILHAVEALGDGDLLLYLVSGGSSSLFEVPLPGLKIDDVIATHRVLLTCGASIADVNRVRAALSAIKAGGLARAAYPARVLTLAVSDVVGDEPAVIGSGPTVPDAAASVALARQVVAERRLCAILPEAINEHLALATVPTGRTAIVDYRIVASNRTAREAAEAALRRRGYDLVPPPLDPLLGDVDAAASAVACAVSAHAGGDMPWAFVAGGETTIRVPMTAGNGGRNRHLACRLAELLEGVGGFALLCAGTDGVDGSGPAAGAIVDGASAGRMRGAGRDPVDALARFDSGAALEAAGDALHTGATGTNVGDLVLAVGASAQRSRA